MTELIATSATKPKDIPLLVDLSNEYPSFPPKTEEVIKSPVAIMDAAKLLIQEMSSGPGQYLFNHSKEKNWKMIENPDFSDLTKEQGLVSVAAADEWISRTHVSGAELGYYTPTIVVQTLKGKYDQATPWVYFRKVYFEVDRFPNTHGSSLDDFGGDITQRDHLANLGFPVLMEKADGTHSRFVMGEVTHLRDQKVTVYGPDGQSLDRSVNQGDLKVPGILVRVNGGTRLYRGE